jgi:tripartite-type tricarboxylate transporter receptor subunit TctC
MMIGTDVVAKSVPDGYTLLYVSNSALTVTPYIFGKTQFDPLHDLVPVTIITHSPYMLVASKSVPGGSLAGLVTYLRANPGKLNHGSNSASTMLVSELFKSIAQVEYIDVNFRGASSALVATQSGTTQFSFVDSGSGAIALQNNELRALAITTAERYKLSPNIPTFAEQGFPGLAVTSTTVLLAPRDTDPNIVNAINQAARKTLQSTDVAARLHAVGLEAGGQSGDEAYQALLDVAQGWAKLIKERNIKFEGRQ